MYPEDIFSSIFTNHIHTQRYASCFAQLNSFTFISFQILIKEGECNEPSLTTAVYPLNTCCICISSSVTLLFSFLSHLFYYSFSVFRLLTDLYSQVNFEYCYRIFYCFFCFGSFFCSF